MSRSEATDEPPAAVERLPAEAECRAAFNAGCDARLAGVALAGNPHTAGNRHLQQWWRLGWKDVNDFWGLLAPGCVRPLPPIRKARSGRGTRATGVNEARDGGSGPGPSSRPDSAPTRPPPTAEVPEKPGGG